MQQIERDEGDRPLPRQPRHLPGGGLMDPLLQPLESDGLASVVQRHHLAVDRAPA